MDTVLQRLCRELHNRGIERTPAEVVAYCVGMGLDPREFLTDIGMTVISIDLSEEHK